MYGILPQQTDIESESFQVTLRGFFKDVITQLKRDLTGFWVAHPDFVRLGLAIVEAWKLYAAGNEKPLYDLTKGIFIDQYRKEVDQFIRGDDIAGLDKASPNYVRSLLVADIKESDYIAGNHPDEIRYNVFQSLQYLTDWLSGNGCVALPTIINGIPVRVMDDLATAERSRWEVWHEIRHGRFKVEDFLRIAHEEMRFIRKDLSDAKKIVQVKWDDRTAKWYPVAFNIMIQMMTAENPVEFATELLMPFTVEQIRKADDPWALATRLDPGKFRVNPYVRRWNYYFERCGTGRFAAELAKDTVLDLHRVESLIRGFTVDEMIEAASFHGDIGESPKTLDHHAKYEQKLVTDIESAAKSELRALAAQYLAKFGFKFLVSAKGKSAEELLAILHIRFDNDRDTEISNAKTALWLITLKRIKDHPLDSVLDRLTKLAETHHIAGAQIAISNAFGSQCVNIGEAVKGQGAVQSSTLFELASLSKTIASAFAMEFFAKAGISLDDRVNALFSKTKSQFRLQSSGGSVWADHVTVADLMRHSALNMHYVKGFPSDHGVPPAAEIAFNGPQFGYERVSVISNPGTSFKYSGGGFIVLEYLIEALSGKSIHDLTEPFFKALGLSHLTFTQKSLNGHTYADGYFDDGRVVPGGRLLFPAFAAGAMGSAEDMLTFLGHLGRAFMDLNGSGPISHDTAMIMLHGRDLGCREFMGCDMGFGVFVADMGDNRVAIHQGANEGFRAIYIYAFSGPDAGKGFVVLCNADNRGVRFIAEVAQTLLKALDVSGVDFAKFSSNFDYSKLSQEQIVNLGYKNLVFNAFKPMLPVPIHRTLAKDPLAEFNLLVDAEVVAVSCQKFARAENLFSPFPPEFDPEWFCAQGKVMDSWESKRHNDDPCDKLTLKLRHLDAVQYVSLSTKYHDGNQARFVRLLGRGAGDTEWREFLPKTSMNGHAARYIRLDRPTANLTDVLIEMYPDGGLSRVGLYKFLPDSVQEPFKSLSHSVCERFADEIPKTHKPLVISYKPDPTEIERNLAGPLEKDYGSAAFGAVMVKATNEHYGPAGQVISPFPPIHMFDGLESARSRDAGHFEEVEIKLAREVRISRVVLDFKFFVNNNPRAVILFALVDGEWKDISGVVPVKAFAANKKEIRIKEKVLSERIRLRTLPDGGVHRIHIY
jgi:allantoicase